MGSSANQVARSGMAVLLSVSTMAAVIGGAPIAASAHDELISSTPAEGAVLDAAPKIVTLHFEEPPGKGPITLGVVGPNKKNVVKGAPHLTASDISIALQPTKLTGRYTIDYGIVSDDGHPVSGAISFTVKPAATASAAPTSTVSKAPAAAKHSSNSSIGLLVAGILVALIAGVSASVRNQRKRRAAA